MISLKKTNKILIFKMTYETRIKDLKKYSSCDLAPFGLIQIGI